MSNQDTLKLSISPTSFSEIGNSFHKHLELDGMQQLFPYNYIQMMVFSLLDTCVPIG